MCARPETEKEQAKQAVARNVVDRLVKEKRQKCSSCIALERFCIRRSKAYRNSQVAWLIVAIVVIVATRLADIETTPTAESVAEYWYQRRAQAASE